MVPTVQELDREVDRENVRKYAHPTLPLIGYTYTFQCEMKNAWNPINRWARGIIFDTSDNLVALPFPKFFNLGQHHETQTYNIPAEPFVSTRKEDGSLIIVFNYEGEWLTATKGSFASEQALWAADKIRGMSEWLNDNVPDNLTLLFEGIYPANRIVVHYKGAEKLMFLSCYDRIGRYELPQITSIFSAAQIEESKQYFDIVPAFDFEKIEEAVAHAETVTGFEQEGYVLRFMNGLRVKIKSEDYKRIHRIVSYSTPLSIWESFDMLKSETEAPRVKRKYWEGIPDEFLPNMRKYEEDLRAKYNKILNDIWWARELAMFKVNGKTPSRKEICIYLKKEYPEIMSLVISLMDKNLDRLHKSIMQIIRPSGNMIV
jgi:RNA ligase